MWWRETQAEFSRLLGEGNRKAMKAIVDESGVPGLLGYLDGEPVGWCSVAPRGEFGRLNRSPTLRAVDTRPVWSIPCFFVDRHHRNQGVASALLSGAVRYAKKRGAKIVEGYPMDPDSGRVDSSTAYVGIASMFRKVGFEEVARRSKPRPIMRLSLASRPRVAK